MRPHRFLAPVLLTISLAAGTLVAASAPAGARAERRVAPTVQVSVMTQNIFYGGDDYQLSTGEFCPVADGCPRALHRLARIIAASGADVVGVQEAERNTRRLAGLLGWYASPQAHVISRFPILDPPHSHGLFTYVEPVPGRVIAVANTHLPSTPYGPYQVRAGWSHQRVMKLERSSAPARPRARPEQAAEARRAGHPGVPDRRLQQPLVPRLDAEGRACPR